MKNKTNTGRWIAVALIALGIFGAAYAFGQSRNVSTNSTALAQTAGYVDPAAAQQAVAQAQQQQAAPSAGSAGGSCCGGGASSSGGSCCGSGQPTSGGVTGAENPGTAQLSGGVQRITVDASSGTYSPNVVNLKAGVPAEITFTQATGCTAVVQSQALNFQVDTTSGPQVVKVPALKSGTYGFNCGMGMVFGKIVVR